MRTLIAGINFVFEPFQVLLMRRFNKIVSHYIELIRCLLKLRLNNLIFTSNIYVRFTPPMRTGFTIIPTVYDNPFPKIDNQFRPVSATSHVR